MTYLNYRGRMMKENEIYSVERNSQNQIWSVDFHSSWSKLDFQPRNLCLSYPASIMRTLGKDESTFGNIQDLLFTKKGEFSTCTS